MVLLIKLEELCEDSIQKGQAFLSWAYSILIWNYVVSIRTGEKSLTSSSSSAAGCSVILVPAPLCILHEDAEHEHRVSPRLMITTGWSSGPGLLWEWRMPSHPGIISQEAAPELWVLWCPTKRERVAVTVQRKLQRKPPPPLGDLSSSSTEVRELHPQLGLHMFVSQAAIPGSCLLC